MKNNSTEQMLLQILQNKFPANKLKWSKMELLSPIDAIFLSYGIEPPNEKLGNFELYSYVDNRPEEIDPYSIYALVQNAIQSGSLPLYNHSQIQSEEFVKWADKQNIPIQKDFFRAINLEIDLQGQDSNTKKSRKPRKESLRKDICIALGALILRQAEEKGKPRPTPADLAKNKSIKETVKNINKEFEIEELTNETGVDPEWFKSLYPEEKRSGPKKKQK